MRLAGGQTSKNDACGRILRANVSSVCRGEGGRKEGEGERERERCAGAPCYIRLSVLRSRFARKMSSVSGG